MFRNLIYLITLLTAISCGKDVVIIEKPIPQEEKDETFEVNLIGFTSDENRAFVPNSTLNINGQNLISDESGLFHLEKILVGQKGEVIELKKDGYLPSIIRVNNHRSVESVILNLELVDEPQIKTLPPAGGSVSDEFGEMTIGEGALNSNTDFIFKSFVGLDANKGNGDQLFFENQTSFLLKEASFFVQGNLPINPNTTISIKINTDEFNTSDVTKLTLFHYDNTLKTWEEVNSDLVLNGQEINFSIQEYGWWTIAEKVPAVYANLNLSQLDGTALVSAETAISFENDNYSSANLYTSKSGSISTYFPIDISITASFNEGLYKAEFTSGFDPNSVEGSINFQEEIQTPFDGLVYACDFTFADGYVAIIEENQHKVVGIENGEFSSEAIISSDDVVLQFYSNEYEFVSKKTSDVEALKNKINSFFSCNDLTDNLLVKAGSNLLQDFDQCRVKVRPNETVVIGERTNGEPFLLSFDGAAEGEYEGLIYFPEITDVDVKSEVMVNIVLYDQIENKLGGFVKTKYISSEEELIISFIGNIE